MAFHITVLSDDGIGREVSREAIRILHAVNSFYNCEFEIQEKPIGGAAIEETGTPLLESTLQACLESDALLWGAVGEQQFPAVRPCEGTKECLLHLLGILGAFANVSQVVSRKGVADCSFLQRAKTEDMDVLVVRELAQETQLYTRKASGEYPARHSMEEIKRIAHLAFGQARARSKRLVSIDATEIVDNCGIWRDAMIKVSRHYPDVKLDHMDMDSWAVDLAANPTYFDVIVTPDFFGDVVVGKVTAAAGLPKILASATMTEKVNLYEPVFGPDVDLAEKDMANPLGAISAAALLLRHSAGMREEASDLEAAIRRVLDAGYRTTDSAWPGDSHIVGTTEMGLLVEQAFMEILDRRFAFHAV
jgi:3-isopropylmalate dehydrogenase